MRRSAVSIFWGSRVTSVADLRRYDIVLRVLDGWPSVATSDWSRLRYSGKRIGGGHGGSPVQVLWCVAYRSIHRVEVWLNERRLFARPPSRIDVFQSVASEHQQYSLV